MVSRCLLRFAFLVALAFAGSLLLVRVWPHGDTPLHALLHPPGCSAPCWEGIRPGETSLDQAVAILEHHPWIAQIRFHWDYPNESPPTPYGWLTWDWSGQQPDWIDGDYPGLLAARDATAEAVILQTTILLGEVHALLGQPASGNVTILRYTDIPITFDPSLSIDPDFVTFRSPFRLYWSQVGVVIGSLETSCVSLPDAPNLPHIVYNLVSCPNTRE